MNIEINKKINNDIHEYQLKQYRLLEQIQQELLENNKYLDENKPYLNKMFFNELNNYNTYVNDYGFLITFTDNPNIHTDNSCPTDSIRQGPELYAFTHEGSVINNQPMCNIFGKNVKDKTTNDIAWVDIEGYKHTYNHNSWSNRDISCKEPVILLTHKQYSSIPTSNYEMNNKKRCMKTTVNSALIYELYKVNNDFIQYLKRIKGEQKTNNKIKQMIDKIEKQNLYIVQEMNEKQSIEAMLQDSVVKKDMYQYQFISWCLVSVLGIGLISHFGKKKL